jgi:hypothetical protein
MITDQTTILDKKVTNIHKQIDEFEALYEKEIKNEKETIIDTSSDTSTKVVDEEYTSVLKNKSTTINNKIEKVTNKINELTT